MMRSTRSSLFIIVTILISIGVIMIYSTSAIYANEKMHDSLYFLKRHLVYLAAGIFMMLLAMAVDLKSLKKYSKHIIALSVLLLVLVLIPHIGKETAGARRWFKIGPLNFQPSEFAKIAIFIYLADLLTRKEKVIKSFLYGYLPPIIALGVVLGLVLMEPDLGTAIAISVVGVLMLFVSGARPLYIFASFLASIPALYVLLFRVAYRRKRMMIFLNPWSDKRGAGFQIIQSFVALGSGGLLGVGLGQSRQKLFYLPASHTDFIFSIIGEELGFIGAASVVILFILFVWEGMKITFKAEDKFERLLSMALVCLIALEAVINIGVTAGVLPTKGLPLPFISYGGTSLMFHLAAVGLLLNIAKSSEVYR
jgi:cell division protein FtsW